MATAVRRHSIADGESRISAEQMQEVVGELSIVANRLSQTVDQLARVIGDSANGASLAPDAAIGGTSDQGPVAAPATTGISTYTDDPFSEASATADPALAIPIPVAVPNNANANLQTKINAPTPTPKQYPQGSANFRYWVAEESITRAINFWAPLLPPGTIWSTVPHPMPITLDAGEDLNAFYSRQNGLNFFHAPVQGKTIFSGESPDVACHELGHAILDALRPQLFNAAILEASAIHESFGDMSAILSALQLPPLRSRVLDETGGRLDANSRVSRLAEQLGWAIRQTDPDAVDPDCLRNACNRFFYRPPAQLPPRAPASQLSSEPHSFSRVFTGAFLEILAGIFKTLGTSNDANLAQASRDLGQLLIDGFRTAPITSAYYSQVAAAMIQADRVRNGGKYRPALTAAFVRHGILSLSSVTSLPEMPLPRFAPATPAEAGAHGVVGAAHRPLPFEGDEGFQADASNAPDLPTRTIATRFGLKLWVHASEESEQFEALAASTSGGSTDASDPKDDARAFVEDLVQQGRIDLRAAQSDVPEHAAMAAFATAQREGISRVTHTLVPGEGGKLVLKRLHFDCGLCGCSQHV